MGFTEKKIEQNSKTQLIKSTVFYLVAKKTEDSEL